MIKNNVMNIACNGYNDNLQQWHDKKFAFP